MKTKKFLLRLFNLIIITFMVLNFVTSITGIGGISKADDYEDTNIISIMIDDYSQTSVGGQLLSIFETSLMGIPLIILTAIKLVLMLIPFIFQLIMHGVYAGFEPGFQKDLVAIEDIIFAGANGASNFLDINYFNFDPSVGELTLSFRQSVAKWYFILRLISTAALLVILIYIGIRMALSTIAEEKAKYKEMFLDWVQSVALLFLLHYIILFFIRINSAFVSGLAPEGLAQGKDQMTDVMIKNIINSIFYSSIGGFIAVFIYLLIVGQIAKFFILYVKRMITVGFLIMISPLITITYAIDKIGDGKAQALNAWLKELAYNILIQPFHCVLLLCFYNAIAKVMYDNTSALFGQGRSNSSIYICYINYEFYGKS